MSTTLRLYLLGQFKLLTNDQSLELPSRPAQSLLAYLALNAEVRHRREKLASLFWPETTETNARSYLRQALWRIRKTLESGSLAWEDYLQVSDIEIVFAPQSEFWLDAGQLLQPAEGQSVEQLIEILRLYRGELLPGFYEEWVESERDRLRAAYHQKMSLLLERLLLSRRWSEALNWGEQWIRLGNSPEPAFRALMRAHAGLGDQGMVSATYQRCREWLDRNLGLEPSPETRRLFEQILQGEWAEPGSAAADSPGFRAGRPAFLDAGEIQPVELSVFVDREAELARLEGFLKPALSGQGRVVFITGEVGSGKTALVQEFSRRVQAVYPDLVVAYGNCNAYTGVGDPYLPFREVLGLLTGDVEARWTAGAISRDHALRLWNSLPISAEALVESGQDLIDTLIPGAALMNRAAACAPGGADWLSRLTALYTRKNTHPSAPGLLQGAIFEQYTRVMRRVSQAIALVLVLDDLQWVDSGSAGLLFHLGRQLSGSRILVLGAYRKEEVAMGREGGRHPLEPVIHEFQREYGARTLELGQAEPLAFVGALLDSEPNRLGLEFRDMLQRRTHAHPLFTIELLRGMQERGDLVLNQAGQWVEGAALDWEVLPARVEAVIAERIDRLPQLLLNTLQAASVVGEVFTAEVVARMTGIEESELLGLLSGELDRKHHLILAESIQRSGDQLLSRYRFRHILFQIYLYSSLDEVERAHLHERAGNAMEALYKAQEEQPDIALQLARHFEGAGDPERAVRYLLLAGDQSLQISAYQEALTSLKKGLALLTDLPDSPDRAQQELDLQLALGRAWMGPRGYHAEVKSTYARARQLSQQLGETGQLSRVLGHLATYHYVRAEYQQAREFAIEALNLAKRMDDPIYEALNHWQLGFIYFANGDYAKTRDHLKRVVDFYDPTEHHRPFLSLRGSDPGVSAYAYEACNLWCLGYPERALERSRQALALARELEHPLSLVDVLCYGGCMFHAMRRDAPALKNLAEELVQLSKEIGFPMWIEVGTCFLGESLFLSGQVEEGIAWLHQGIFGRESLEERCYLPGLLRPLAEALAKTGQPEEGLTTIEKALDLVEKTGERHWEAELRRLRGELLLMLGDPEGAGASFLKAIAVSRRQEAKSWELRAATSLARLRQIQGRAAEARQMLAEVYNWFTEGLETRDLKEAGALLEELAGKS